MMLLVHGVKSRSETLQLKTGMTEGIYYCRFPLVYSQIWGKKKKISLGSTFTDRHYRKAHTQTSILFKQKWICVNNNAAIKGIEDRTLAVAIIYTLCSHGCIWDWFSLVRTDSCSLPLSQLTLSSCHNFTHYFIK